MDATARDRAIAAASKSYSHVLAARRALIGERMPLAGVHWDADKALLQLQAAQRSIEEAARVIEAYQRAADTQEGPAPVTGTTASG
jgi:hypothetical protein